MALWSSSGRAIPDPHQLQHWGEQAPHLARWVSQPWSCECRELPPFLICLVATWEGERSPPLCPSMPRTGGRTGLMVRSVKLSRIPTGADPTLLAEVCVSHRGNHEHGTAALISHPTDQLYSCPGPGLWLPASTYTPSMICWSTCRDLACRPKAADLHNTGRQRDVQEES